MIRVRDVRFAILASLLLTACSTEEARTQITLMIDAEPLVKSQIESVSVDFRSGRTGTPATDFTAREPQVFDAPIQWPLVVVLLPTGDEPNRAFEIKVSGSNSAGVVVQTSARSHFIKGKTLALRMRLLDACRNAVFGSCGDGLTCVVNNGTPTCADNEIDPATLPPFVSVDPAADGGFDTGTDADVPVTREVTGRVFSTNGMLPLPGARVALASGASTVTDDNGDFTIERSASDDALTVDSDDHADVIKQLPDAASVYLEIFVMKVDVRQNVAAVIGGMVQSVKGAAATFPASAFKKENGTLETAEVEVTLSEPDVKDPSQAQAFPGDFKATDAGGKEGSLSTVAALDVSAKAGSEKLNIADGKEVDVTFPTKEANAPQVADLWSFDTVERAWKKEGVATLTQDSSGRKVYRAKISHLSWWAVGTLVEEHTCLHLCARFNGAPAPFARATVSGIDQPFQGAFYADMTGCLAFDVPLSTQLSLVVQSIDGSSSPRVLVTTGMTGDSSNIATCQDLGVIALLPRMAMDAACPSALISCGGNGCFDVNRDAQRCGSCSGGSCQLDQTCIDGGCTCNNSESLCSDGCADLRSDRLNCGTCGNVCATTDRCVMGQCAAAGCAPPTISCNGICVNVAIDGVNGMCPTAPACGTRTDCGGVCADLMNDAAHCGACNAPICTGVCVSGICEVCNPQSCIANGFNCGTFNDGCGGMINCGTCPGGEMCMNNVCAPVAACGSDVGTCRTGALMCQGGAAMCVGEVTATAEVCDGQDNDCDGMIDNNAAGIGGPCGNDIGECVAGVLQCQAGAPVCVGGSAPSAEICDGRDNDCDGNFDESFTGSACGITGGACVAGMQVCQGGSVVCTGAIGPSAEICDGIDNDCDGAADNGCTCPAGYGDCDANPANGCERAIATPTNCGACGVVCPSGRCNGTSCMPIICGDGYRDASEQCDDNNTSPADGCNATCMREAGFICPMAGSACSPIADACDNIDNDSDSFIDEGPWGQPCSSGPASCAPGLLGCASGTQTCSGEALGSIEVCDGLDNDCDLNVDEGNPGGGGVCALNTGECAAGTTMCGSGSLICVGSIGPTAEVCDSLDNDCDGFVDENTPNSGTPCGSSVGQCRPGMMTCIAGSLVCQGERFPSIELCDSLDNDCDGVVDETITPGPACGTNTGECMMGLMTCTAGTLACQGAIGPSAEFTNNLDDDCDGIVDEGVITCP